jgi:hypothetical protein
MPADAGQELSVVCEDLTAIPSRCSLHDDNTSDNRSCPNLQSAPIRNAPAFRRLAAITSPDYARAAPARESCAWNDSDFVAPFPARL